MKSVAAFDWGRSEARGHEIPVAVMLVPISCLAAVYGDRSEGLVLSFGTGAMWSDLIGLTIDRPSSLQHLEVEGIQAFVHPHCKLLRLSGEGFRDR